MELFRLNDVVVVLGGAGSFIIFFIADYFEINYKKTAKVLAWVTGFIVLLFFHYCAFISRDKIFHFPFYIRVAAFILAFIFFLFMLYSVSIEIYLHKKRGLTYSESGLITTGTYAICRHPGIIWYILMLTGLFISSGSKAMLVAIPIWGGMDILYAHIQDRYFFVKLFGDDYKRYRETTPEFIPTLKSIKKACKTCLITRRTKE